VVGGVISLSYTAFDKKWRRYNSKEKVREQFHYDELG